MTNDNLEAFMLISIEKSILMELDNYIIIKELQGIIKIIF
ncbi:hypothetical protein FWK35_00030951 [Aphis craccivora]|uniref:Uncharacterized protein n=1 Tax=Aphis craccivora TaxID=307492 RepID=A0A6G0Y4U5_APHCR|nr:hypothetical protein FWK35_00030951 [Aphis craccivora]